MNAATTCAKLMSLGAPKETASNVVKTLEKWITNNGVEWTIDHLKDMKQVFLGKLAGVPVTTKTWVKLRPDGYPAGPMLSTFLRQKTVTPRRVTQALTILTSYSMYFAPQCTPRQKEKFFGSMTSTDKTGMTSKLRIVPRTIPYVSSPFQKLRPFMAQCISDTRRAPGPNLKSCPESDYLSVLRHALDSDSISSIIGQFPKISERVLPQRDYTDRYMMERFTPDRKRKSKLLDNYGSISGIQEPGFKLRAVANPSRIIQAMLEPLKDLVMDHLKTLPTDHTHDQMAAIPKVQEMLRSGEVVHSVDLSDATNLFPLPLQVDLLRKMCHKDYFEFIQVFELVSKGNWLTHLNGAPELVKFSRGQPLGLGPSFGVFALAHNTLLEGLCMKHRLNPVDHFVVLGDDVVIRGDKLNRLYRESLCNFGCKISESKTISSTRLAEFAGVVITRDYIAKGYKWRDVSDHSFMDMAKALGPKVMGFLHPWQRDFVKTMGPIHRDLGGLGWSSGEPLHLMWANSPISEAIVNLIGSKGELEKLVLFRDLIPEAVRVIRALQPIRPEFTRRYSEDDTLLKGEVSRIWPAKMFMLADDLRSRGVLRPQYVITAKPDKVTESMALWARPLSDPRPSSLSLIQSIIDMDPKASSMVPKSVLKRMKQRDCSPVIQFTDKQPVVSPPVPKQNKEVRSSNTKSSGIDM